MNKYTSSIKQAQDLIKRTTDAVHAYPHAESVVETIKELCKSYPQVNEDLIEAAGWWHDSGREISDEGHEKISADLVVENFKNLGFSKEEQDTIYKAIELHKWSMQPKTLEGEILRDADKIDFISIDRWQAGIAINQFFHLKNIAYLLPKLRNEILHLPQSRLIYDQRIKPFIVYIANIKSNNPEVIKLKEQVLQRYSDR